jgi:hypothetical protein
MREGQAVVLGRFGVRADSLAEDECTLPGELHGRVSRASLTLVGTMSDVAPTFDAIAIGAGFGGIRMLDELARDAFPKPTSIHRHSAEPALRAGQRQVRTAASRRSFSLAVPRG